MVGMSFAFHISGYSIERYEKKKRKNVQRGMTCRRLNPKINLNEKDRSFH
jgi:hypothetical protein